MNKKNYGSIWHKWDLHVHTPNSVLFNEFNNDWDKYFKALVEQAYHHQIIAVGITDYYSISGYKHIIENYLSKKSKLDSLFGPNSDVRKHLDQMIFFPNIELRLKKFVGTNKINFHVLFSDKVDVTDIETNFLAQINFEYDHTGGTPQILPITVQNIEKLGAKLKKEQPEFTGTDLFEGMKNIAIDEDEILSVLKGKEAIFRDKYLLIVEADEDLSKLPWNGQDHQARKQLIKKSHALFARNKGTIEFGLGKRHSSINEFIQEFGSLKPSYKCCDAHKESKFFINSNSEYTWIKSEVSFSGLMQTILEPLDRVSISQVKPDEKNSFQIINSLKFIPTSTELLISTEKIYFNPNLTSVIGGKSSGKSLLLYHLAKTANPKITSAAFWGKEEPYDAFLNSNYDVEVEWSDGHLDKISHEPENRNRQIVYIPQLYVNALVDKEQHVELNNLISEILDQNEEYWKKRSKILKDISYTNSEITKILTDFFSSNSQYDMLSDAAEKMGQTESIKKELSKIEMEISTLVRLSNMTDEESQEIKNLTKRHSDIQIELQSKEKVILKLEELQKHVSASNIQDIISNYIQSRIVDIEEDAINDTEFTIEAKKIESSIIDTIIKSLNGKNYFGRLATLKSELGNKKNELIVVNNKLKPLIEKIKFTEKINQLGKIKTDLNVQLQRVTTAEHDIKKVHDIRKSIAHKLFTLLEKRIELYSFMIKNITEGDFSSISDDLKLNAKISFDHENFNIKFVSLIDKRNLKTNFSEDIDEDGNFKTPSSIATQKKILTLLIQDKVKLRAGVTMEEAGTFLFEDYFNLNFNLTYKDDDLKKMSPGKRGLVILQLILEVSNSKDPILIDQPEDNLDNRTIFSELVKFVRSKKRERQIILVTHNANIVVGADSELVIVANQDGQNSIRGNREFKFEFVSGPLEKSKIFDGNEKGVLYQMGIKEHVCDILEGGHQAFKARGKKYSL